MGGNDREIMVVKRSTLLSGGHFDGFRPHHEVDYESRILSNFEYMRKADAEIDPNFKQPIGYCVIVDPVQRKVFLYQRASKDKAYSEKRLSSKWSLGVGGHIESDDSRDNPIQSSLQRELEEEIGLKNLSGLRVAGYINHEGTPVDRVHFGVMYLAENTNWDIAPQEAEIGSWSLVGLDELERMATSGSHEFEEWSKIALTALRDYFSMQNFQ